MEMKPEHKPFRNETASWKAHENILRMIVTIRRMCFCTQVYKPGSVLTAIYLALRLPAGSSRLLGTAGSACCPSTALLRDRVYSVKPMLPWAGCALTAPFHHHRQGRLYLSVALVLRSPSAGVTRYPCPVEPGLSSSAAFRPASAAVRPGSGNIVLQHGQIVKCLAKSFEKGYTIFKRGGIPRGCPTIGNEVIL